MKERNPMIEKYLISDNHKAGRIGLTKEDIQTSFLENLFYGIGRIPALATNKDLYTALALAIRDRV